MLPWKLRKRQILPVNQNLSTVYFSPAKFQLVSCNLSLAMIWQMTYTHKLPKLCSATLIRRTSFTSSTIASGQSAVKYPNKHGGGSRRRLWFARWFAKKSFYFSCHPGGEETEKNATKFLACCHHKKAIYDEYMCYRSAVKCVTKKCNTSLQSFVWEAPEKYGMV